MSAPASARDAIPFKIVIAGGFGAGKTTFVGAISEITPLRTEEALTLAGVGTDDLDGIPDKSTTTVAMDFGRRTLDRSFESAPDLQLLLFGTPGQDRFWFMWDDLTNGAVGAVVLVDTRRLADCFAAVEYFERRGLPFLVAINRFEGAYPYPEDKVRAAIRLNPTVPVVSCDARQEQSARAVLVALVQHAYNRASLTATSVGAEHVQS
ncbi:ATP/GTP-binding protein [Streptomyces sp. 8L]|nr:ATP/GTP-binding protein [Streptomyces sp. 8L]MCA1220045.1 ATP/GTP-binding protein [Streptomyces sp. 8L]